MSSSKDLFYLSRIKIKRFGAFSDRLIGPFTPHLNIVYGSNEAGKTTLSSFIGGVLFGWEEARGRKNTYKPQDSERSGSLFFSRKAPDVSENVTLGAKEFRDVSKEECELSRTRNADGLSGDASLVDDVDKATYKTIFSLTSDELRSLRNTTEITAKLLTAGSGTSASPAAALAEINARIGEYTSQAAGIPHSLVRLAAERDRLQGEIARAAQEADRYKQEDREFHELCPKRASLQAAAADINREIEHLAAARASAEKLNARREEIAEELEIVLTDEQRIDATQNSSDDTSDFPVLTESDERKAKAYIETYSEKLLKASHDTDLAKETYTTSRAAYEAIIEADDAPARAKKYNRQKWMQIGLAVLLTLAFLGTGLPLFIHGRQTGSLSFTCAGCALMVFSLLLAVVSFVLILSPNKAENQLATRIDDLRWIMLQDKKKYEACVQEQQQLEKEIKENLDERGFSAAEGSLQQAKALIDQAREIRSVQNQRDQRMRSLALRRESAQKSAISVEAQWEDLFNRAHLGETPTSEALEDAFSLRCEQRDRLLETIEQVNQRYGQLEQELAQAKRLRDFDKIKLEYQQINTRAAEASCDFIRLHLARRMLESSIAAWESKSQPEVYQRASELLSLMTDGRWVSVSLSYESRLQVTDNMKTTRDPLHLSLSTCQQLYLSLRIALLETAENVGRSIPVLADDILVNFDEARREGAAKALAQLAQSRQVILFTCQRDVVKALQKADPDAQLMTL